MTKRNSPHHWKHDKYCVETYVAYTSSIALEVERRVRDQPPRRPASFWRYWNEEIERAKLRFNRCTPLFTDKFEGS